MHQDLLLSALGVVRILCTLLVVVKLYQTGLYRNYPIFFAFFIFRIPNSIWPMLLNVTSPFYQKVWMVTDPVGMIFHVLMVGELYKRVLVRHRGIYSLGKWILCFSLAVSTLLSVASLLPKITPDMPQNSRNMFFIFAAERGIDTALVLLIALLLGFLCLVPVRLSQNVRWHAVITFVFFLGGTLTLLGKSLFGLRLYNELNLALLLLITGSVVAWLLLLQKVGEGTVPLPVRRFDQENEDRLLAHLESLNRTVLRISDR